MFFVFVGFVCDGLSITLSYHRDAAKLCGLFSIHAFNTHSVTCFYSDLCQCLNVDTARSGAGIQFARVRWPMVLAESSYSYTKDHKLNSVDTDCDAVTYIRRKSAIRTHWPWVNGSMVPKAIAVNFPCE